MVSGFEVEEGILLHEAVEDCAVIGVASQWGEEDIKAFITTKKGVNLSAQEPREHCRPLMARYMVPAESFFWKKYLARRLGK